MILGNDKDTEPFTLQVDSLEVWNPELNSMTELSQPISSISELPLSFGEPVLMVGNCEDDEFYLVRARDIIGLSRINPRNISWYNQTDYAAKTIFFWNNV